MNWIDWMADAGPGLCVFEELRMFSGALALDSIWKRGGEPAVETEKRFGVGR
jgi:hypothetical protein